MCIVDIVIPFESRPFNLNPVIVAQVYLYTCIILYIHVQCIFTCDSFTAFNLTSQPHYIQLHVP